MMVSQKFSGHGGRVAVLLAFGLLAGSAARAATMIPESLEEVDYQKHVYEFFGEYCFDCHSEDTQKADLNLEAFIETPVMYRERRLWEAVRDMLEHREMPPKKKYQPEEADRMMAVLFIDKELAKFDCDVEANPGRVTLRRLNRVEYRNTIRDLFAVDFDPSENLPLDDVGYGFDNIGDVLSLSPVLLEKYLNAADRVVEAALVTDPAELIPRKTLAGRDLSADSEHTRLEGGTWGLYREGKVAGQIAIDQSGEYRFELEAFGDLAGDELPKLEVRINQEKVALFDVGATRGEKRIYEFEKPLKSGTHDISFHYLNNFNSAGDRNVFLTKADVVGPLGASELQYPEPHRSLIPDMPREGNEIATAETQLRAFATKAFRRPVKDDELSRLVGFVESVLADGGRYVEGMQVAATAVLVSPHFLYRWELDNAADSSEAARLLNDYELASRLSYFLWSSLPDDELFALAEQGKLHEPEVLKAQVERMVADPKSSAIVENFAGQWLQVRNLGINPDPVLFPEYDESLRVAMQRETELFFEAIMRENRSLMDLLGADFTFLNERLAKHYGIPGVEGDEFRRVSLKPEWNRGGILTQGSILALTSNPTRTSPVNRGKWILEQILGAPPPPPPPNVPELDEGGEGVDLTASLRVRLEQHRANPDCATCHQKMDPLGFALENFDAVGKWREKDGEYDIDPSGTMPDGRSFGGPKDLKAMLQQEVGFVRTATEKMLVYALGRGLEFYDKCAVDAILAELEKNDYKMSTLIWEIVRSAPFQQRSNATES